MRALTLSQPWATLHMAPCSLTNDQPPKSVESRSWRKHVDPDEWIVLHAGKGIDRTMRDAVTWQGRFIPPFAELLVASGYSALDPWATGYAENFEKRNPVDRVIYSRREATYRRPLPLGAALGLVRYSECIPGIEVQNRVDRGELPQHELVLGNYRSDVGPRWGFVAVDRILFETPVPMRGFQQFWRLTPEQVTAVQAAAAVAR